VKFTKKYKKLQKKIQKKREKINFNWHIILFIYINMTRQYLNELIRQKTIVRDETILKHLIIYELRLYFEEYE
jgi:hypothetical protein